MGNLEWNLEFGIPNSIPHSIFLIPHSLFP